VDVAGPSRDPASTGSPPVSRIRDALVAAGGVTAEATKSLSTGQAPIRDGHLADLRTATG